MNSIPFVSLEKVKKNFVLASQEISILDELDLCVNLGDQIAILGESGAGKSTLLSLLAGLDRPDAGEIVVGGKNVATMSRVALESFRQKKLGFIFQSFNLIPYLTALENTTLPLEIQGDNEVLIKGKAILDKLGLAGRLNHFPRELSGGEQQRVAIARAAVANPQLILADEPTGNLDQKTGDLVMDYLFSLCSQKNITLIIVTHSHRLARRCQQSYILDKGLLTPTTSGDLAR